MFRSLGEYVKAKEYYEKALAISMEIGDRARRRNMVWKLRKCVSTSLGEYVKAKEYYEKALAISREIGNQTDQARTYLSLATVFLDLREYRQSKLSCDNALEIIMKIGDKEGQAGNVFDSLGEYHLTEGW